MSARMNPWLFEKASRTALMTSDVHPKIAACFSEQIHSDAIEQVWIPVLRSNRIVRRDGLTIWKSETSSSDPPGARLSARTVPVTNKRGLLRQVIGLLELLITDCGFRDNGLDESRAVAN